MKFKDTEALPGVVIDCEDPKKLGRVKATVPGLFDSTQMSVEGLPWIYPATMFGYQQFSKLQEGSKIWVLKQEGNFREFWYLPMFELNADTREIVGNYEEPDVIISRNSGSNSVYVYYTDAEGVMLRMGDNATINMKADGEILVKSGKGQISINGDKVYIGSDKAEEPAVLGNKLKTLLNNLNNGLSKLQSAASPQPYTSHLGAPLLNIITQLNTDINNILCTDTIVS